MRLILQTSVIVLILIVFNDGIQCQSVNLPLDHWAYPFLERLEVKGLFRDVKLRSLPLSRGEIVKIIEEIDQKISNSPEILSKAEREQFEQLKGEFCDDFSKLDITIQNRYREPHLLRWKDNNSHAFVDAVLGETVERQSGDMYDKTELTSKTVLGGILRGSLNKQVYFYLDTRNTLIRGSDIVEENFNPLKGEPVVTSGSNVYSDEAEVYTAFRMSKIQVELGRSEVQWGPGWRGGMTLSNNAPFYDMFKLKVLFSRFKFTSIHAFLRGSNVSKYLAAHRIELQLSPKIFFAGTETVIYGGRDIEFMYLNPLMPYHVAEHHLGDRDNNSISFEFVTFPIKNVKVYS